MVLTGALAGLTLALQSTPLVAMTGAITGIAAALSMAASEYLSTKAEGDGRDPLRASLYTGVAYIFTVLALILPYLVLRNPYLCLAATLAVAVLIIAFFIYLRGSRLALPTAVPGDGRAEPGGGGGQFRHRHHDADGVWHRGMTVAAAM